MARFTAFPEVWEAVKTTLETAAVGTGVSVYEGESGTGGYPHVVMHDVGGRGLDGTVSDPHAWAVLHYQINCIHTSMAYAQQVRKWLFTSPLLSTTSPPQPVGAVIKRVDLLVPNPVFRDDSTAGRPLFMSRDVFAVHAEKVPA